MYYPKLEDEHFERKKEPSLAPSSEYHLVGATGFEPATLCSQSRCATKLRHAPNYFILRENLNHFNNNF